MGKRHHKSGHRNHKSMIMVPHGARVLPSVEVDSYNLVIQEEEGFIGDHANRGAFRTIIDKWREPLRKLGDDPLGDTPTEEITKKELDELLASGEPEVAAVIHSAIEEFASELESVIRRFMKTAHWRETEHIVIGGGFRASRVGELAIARCEVLLKARGIDIQLALIGDHPDEAGLIGVAHLMPAWMLEGFDGLLAVDIGGTNIRVGIVETKLEKARDLSKACVWSSHLWRHGDEKSNRDRGSRHGSSPQGLGRRRRRTYRQAWRPPRPRCGPQCFARTWSPAR